MCDVKKLFLHDVMTAPDDTLLRHVMALRLAALMGPNPEVCLLEE